LETYHTMSAFGLYKDKPVNAVNYQRMLRSEWDHRPITTILHREVIRVNGHVVVQRKLRVRKMK
jgi:hypothetical protein